MAEAVTLSNIAKRFRTRTTELPVLQNVDLHIASGEFLALLGPSGCGKSTLLRLIAGLDSPSEGRVRLGQRSVSGVDPRCGIIFQEPRLFPWKSVSANVALGTRGAPTRHTPQQMLERVGLAGFAGSYPHQLSGGMAQRTALARALIGQPEVLLLDEPFASLDALTRMQMQDLLAEACLDPQPTVVMVTHDVDEALYLADRIVIMSPRPASIGAQIVVPLPRPRDRADAALAPLRSQILSYFGFSHGRATSYELRATI